MENGQGIKRIRNGEWLMYKENWEWRMVKVKREEDFRMVKV